MDSIELFTAAVRTFPWLVARLQNWGLRGGATMIIPSNFAIRDLAHNGINVDQAVLENHIFDGNLTAAVLRTRTTITAWSGATFTVFSTIEAMGDVRSMNYISLGNNLSHGILIATDVGTGSGLGVVHSIDRALLSLDQMPNTTTTAAPPGSSGSETETTVTSEAVILIAIGALLCLLLVVLAVMAACCRGGSGSSQPTVITQQQGYGGPSPVGIYHGHPQQERQQSPHHREPPMAWRPGGSSESLQSPYTDKVPGGASPGGFRRPSQQYLDPVEAQVSPPGRQSSATANQYTGRASVVLRDRPEMDVTPQLNRQSYAGVDNTQEVVNQRYTSGRQ